MTEDHFAVSVATRFTLAVFCIIGPVAAAAQAVTLDNATGTIIDPRPLVPDGYCTRWNFRTNRLAFMAPNADGYYRVFTCRPDGTDRRNICTNPALPTKHIGLPYWHPSGKYLLITAQKQDYSDPKMFGQPDYAGLPGFGVHDDLWLITADGSRCWKLTNIPDARTEGILIPIFSPDGKLLAWSERQPDKTYIIKVADFIEFPQPHLGNIRSYQPGGRAYYELGSFTADSRGLLYSSDQDTHNFWFSQIYHFDLATGRSQRLTVGGKYNEHPIDISTPGGEWIVYMSTRDAKGFPGRMGLGTDFWAMRLDGTGNKRLTTMNRSPSDPQSQGGPRWAGTCSISPGGDYLLGDVQDNLAKQTGMVLVLRLTDR